jgi:hypothetical protein
MINGPIKVSYVGLGGSKDTGRGDRDSNIINL